MNTPEHRSDLQYWSREDAQTSVDDAPLDSVAESANRLTRRPLDLPRDAWRAPALGLWQRLDVQRTLLDNRTDSNRDAKCQRTRFSREADIGIHRNARGGWSTSNVISCGRMTCACCGIRRSRFVASALGALIKNHANPVEKFCDVWMLTLSPPHSADVPLDITIDRLYTACAHFFRSPTWRRFEDTHEIVARVRVLDATHGGNAGSHPHFHVALFPRWAAIETGWVASKQGERMSRRMKNECRDDVADEIVRMVFALEAFEKTPRAGSPFRVWDHIEPLRLRSKRDRAAYLAEIAASRLGDAWRVSCEKAGITVADRAAFARHALTLSPSEDAAAYFTKWGLADEIGASPSKHKSHLRLLDIVAQGCTREATDEQRRAGDRAGDIYRAFREATHRRAWVTGLADAMHAIGVHDEDADAFLADLTARRDAMLAEAGTPVLELAPLDLAIKTYLYPAALKLGWESVFKFCDLIAESAQDVRDVQAALDAMLLRALAGCEVVQQGPPFAEERSRVLEASTYSSCS